jgi:hypothetical protein
LRVAALAHASRPGGHTGAGGDDSRVQGLARGMNRRHPAMPDACTGVGWPWPPGWCWCCWSPWLGARGRCDPTECRRPLGPRPVNPGPAGPHHRHGRRPLETGTARRRPPFIAIRPKGLGGSAGEPDGAGLAAGRPLCLPVTHVIATDLAQLPPATRRSLTWARAARWRSTGSSPRGSGLTCPSAAPGALGSAGRTGTPTGCCPSTSPAVRIGGGSRCATSMTLSSGSTPGHGVRSTGDLGRTVLASRPRPVRAVGRSPSGRAFRRHACPDLCWNGARWRARHTVPSRGSSVGLDSIRSTVKPSRS